MPTIHDIVHPLIGNMDGISQRTLRGQAICCYIE